MRALQLADWIEPRNGGVCFSLARACLQRGNHPDAMRKLECAADGGGLGSDLVESRPLLAPVRRRADWGALVRRALRALPDSTPRR